MASVYLFRVVAQHLFPLVRELLRDHVLDRQTVTGRRLLPMLGFHQFAEDRKRGSGRAPSVGLPGSDALLDLLVSRHSHARVPEPLNPAEPVFDIVFAGAWSAPMGELGRGLVHPGHRPLSQPHAGRPRTDSRENLGESIINLSRAAVFAGVMQQSQRQGPVHVDPQCAQMAQLSLHLPIAMALRRAGDGSVEAGEARESAT